MSQRNKRQRKASKQKLNEAKTPRQCPSGCDCNECSVDLIQYCKHYIECNLYSTSPYRLRDFHFMIDLILFIFGAIYVVFVPYTKHEESLNMQMTHDMLITRCIDLDEYHDYNGRITFIASILLCLMVFPMKLVLTLILPLFVPFGDHHHIDLQKQCQYLIRFALLIVNITALSKFRQSFVLSYFAQETDIYAYDSHKNSKNRAHSTHIKIAMIQRFSLLFTALIIAQFHFLFYSSRLLPNCMALPSVTIAFAHYFRNNWNHTLIWLIISCILFRCDTIIMLIPFIIIILCKQRYVCFRYRLFVHTMLYCTLSMLLCVLCTIIIDSWFWTRFNSISWPEFETLSSKYHAINWRMMYSSYHLLLALIPKMLLINAVFVVFSIFKIYPMLFVHELRKRYFPQKRIKSNTDCSREVNHNINDTKDIRQYNDFAYTKGEYISLFRLMSLFIDWESVSLLFICILFVFVSCAFQIDCNETEMRFALLIVCPPLTLLSTIGCIRLFTVWGHTGFENANYNLFWFKHNLYQRQKQLYFLWIPHNLLFASIVKKLVSIETPITWITFRRYMRVLQEIPYQVLDKVWYRKQTGFSALTVSVSIIVSICCAWYQVYEASYDYPGGVAITMFPRIIANYKTNMAPYGYYDYPFMKEDDDEYTHDIDHEDINDTQYTSTSTRPRPKRTIHSKRGHRMNRDYATIINASVDDEYDYEVRNQSNYHYFQQDEYNEWNVSNPFIESQHEQNGMFELYDAIDCVHIGSLAATSGVTRFLIPSLYEQFRFSKAHQIQIEEYALLKDPCNLYQEMYSKICHNKWNDYMYDEEYFEQRDDYLNDEKITETKPTEIDCYSSIDYRYPTIKGFDYLISEHSSVPGYYLIPHAVIYSKPINSNIINYALSFFESTDNHFLEPSLYVLKREKNVDSHPEHR